jgi:hypothetical protein
MKANVVLPPPERRRQVVNLGAGPWLVVAYCCPLEWARYRCNSRAEAEQYRCGHGCLPAPAPYRLHNRPPALAPCLVVGVSAQE